VIEGCRACCAIITRNLGRSLGGPFHPAPDVRNRFGLEGGLVVLKPPPDPVFFFKPVNAAVLFDDCRFSDLPGQAGIFAPQLVGPDDPAWTFGPDRSKRACSSRTRCSKPRAWV
jgi:hypothetical protein